MLAGEAGVCSVHGKSFPYHHNKAIGIGEVLMLKQVAVSNAYVIFIESSNIFAETLMLLAR
jgi:hypothetical protein